MPDPDHRRADPSRPRTRNEGVEASEFEFGLIIAYNAFTRWVQRCMAAAGAPELSALEILVLQTADNRNREKRLADIGFLLNIEDMHTVTYALRKLVKLDLLISDKRGKEVFYSTSDTGRALCDAYREIRRQCLLDGLDRTPLPGEALREMGTGLRTMSGQYDQASRTASSL